MLGARSRISVRFEGDVLWCAVSNFRVYLPIFSFNKKFNSCVRECQNFVAVICNKAM